MTSDPAAINCPGTCSSNFTQDEHVTLTATPNADATFTSFSSNCALANPPTESAFVHRHDEDCANGDREFSAAPRPILI